ncbi:cobaltochelatase subunit CobN [Poseidonibacter antarcticus]|uniref:cobaltochelatase subunit CobN n=1 Tax=Poseidonibacter antarcticus TaxID=2478538 RepID=UPI000EF4CE02|nr:cobaltochelatase subunit CobN [Poseidonibacter antarcticus]
MLSLKHFLMFYIMFIFTINIFAQENSKSIFSVVSNRSAASLNAGANYYLKDSKDKISIRSVSQILNMSNSEIQEEINKADIVLYTAVFGDVVEKLLSKNYDDVKTVVSIQGDRRLIALNKDISKANYTSLPSKLLEKDKEISSYQELLNLKQKEFKNYSYYLQARAYWDNRGSQNISNLFSFLSNSTLDKSKWSKVLELKPVRYFLNANASKTYESIDELKKDLKDDTNVIFILDNDRADNSSDWKIHEEIYKQSKLQVVSILSSWGKPSFQAVHSLEVLTKSFSSKQAFSIISLQDFVIGGGESRQDVTKSLENLNVPVLKALRVLDTNALAYSLSSQGLPVNSVHYRISMPELQGIGQVYILAMNNDSSHDLKTGALIIDTKLMKDEIKNIIKKSKAWMNLKTKENKDKKIAIIYYNHPPGRHNIGADNLNVPASLFKILNELSSKGYNVGELPNSSEELLDLLQEKGVNLPNDKKALKQLSKKVPTVKLEDYEAYLKTLPLDIQAEMKFGPLAALDSKIVNFLDEEIKGVKASNKVSSYKAIKDYMHKTIANLHHALDGVRSKSRQRSINLLKQLEDEYEKILKLSQDEKEFNYKNSSALKNAIIKMEIEGLRGWGEAPGVVMVWDNELLIPSVTFGNVILAPQPPRGWELNEELLHANLSFPPTHQYLAFYYYMKDKFKADGIIHVGRHSTYEFLPRKSVGLSASDYPSIIIEGIPSIYPYIVDGVGEGIQAKRRGQAIIIDHLTPPLATTKLYDNLLELRQLIESAEAASDDNIRKNAINKIKISIDEMNLRDELIASMDEELKVRGIGFDEVDDEFLLHEVGHYLTHLQEEFMPLGLHTFGQNWTSEAVDTMIESMSKDSVVSQETKQNLIISPKKELESLVNALNGGYVNAGKGNDPIRTASALPTGRNFYALDGSLIPSTIGYEMGVKLAQNIREKKEKNSHKKEAVILWASDTVRDEGAMVAFGLDLLGVKPIWNSRGILKGLEKLPLDEKRTRRIDVVFTSSGLFRDLYGAQLALLNKAVLMAIDSSYNVIINKYPALTLSIESALSSLGELKVGGSESLEVNAVASNWVKEAREILKNNPHINLEELGKRASYRVFATAPGSYGAGINRLVERSSSWNDRKELGDVFIKRVGYAYTQDLEGHIATDSYKRQLKNVENTYLGRASNLYGLIDNNDTFDYLGGLNLAIETVTGKQPNSFVIDNSNAKDVKIQSLQTALLGELRGRFLNPQWIKPLMNEGYSGARTMGSEFIEYLWGWQVTSPEIITNWVWEDVKAVYIDDKLDLGLDEFLSSNHQVQVQTNILAVMLVAIQKDFWKADEQTQEQLAKAFAQNIIKYGIPGSGHTHANHPIYDFVKTKIDKETASKLEKVLSQSRLDKVAKKTTPNTIQEIKIEEKTQKITQEQNKKDEKTEQKNKESKEETEDKQNESFMMYFIFATILILLAGLIKSIFFSRVKG